MTSQAVQNNKVLHLIERVYEAAVDERAWHSLAPQIARTFESTSTNLQIQGTGEPRVLTMTENVSAGIGAYRNYYWQRDIWVERATKLGVARVLASKDVVADSEFRETEFYRDWCRSLDVFYVVGAVFQTGKDELGIIGIHRPKGAGTYQDTDVQLVARFLPHLRRALQIRNRIGQAALARRVFDETLNRTDTATIVVVADGHIVLTNPVAETLLANGTAVRVHKGRLTTTNQFDTGRLLSLVRSASNMGEAQNEPGGVMAVRQANAPPLTVLVAPFRLALPGLATPSAIVFIRDPNRPISAAGSLQALFQLTPAEARIAQELANGKSLAEIAASHGARLQTVRKQLKSIFAKTGTNRQAQCVAAILRSVAAIAQD